MMSFLFLYCFLFLAAAVLSTLFCLIILHISRKIGFLDQPEAHKKHTTAVPYGGGFGIAFAILITLGALFLLLMLHPAHTTNQSNNRVENHTFITSTAEPLNKAFQQQSEVETESGFTLMTRVLSILVGAVILLLFGALDDKKPMRAMTKLLIQTAVTAGVVTLGVRGGFLIDDLGIAGAAGAWCISVLWILFVTNSFNLLDNMDGLSAGTAAIISFCLIIIAVFTHQPAMGVLMAAVAGGCCGFLILNWHPARLYMGDAGSQFIGFLFGCLTISFTYFNIAEIKLTTSSSPLGLLIPPLLLAIPLYDTCSVIWIRLKEKRPIWVGDRCHFSHRLVDLGLTVPKAVMIIFLAQLAMGLSAVLLIFLPWTVGLIVLGQAILVFTIIAALENTGRCSAPPPSTNA